MVFVMVYMMICYNIALNIGSMNNSVFLSALHEFVIMAPVAFVLDFFFVGHIAKKTAFCIVNPKRENPFHLVLAISAVSVAWMCPLMSLAATILINYPGASTQALCSAPTSPLTALAFLSCSRKIESGV